MDVPDLTSFYARVNLRGLVREALLTPLPFAQWAKGAVVNSGEMEKWRTRQWFEAFLQTLTRVPWRVSGTSMQMTNWSGRDPHQSLVAKQQPLDDPPMALQPWMQAMALEDAHRAVLMVFVDSVLANAQHSTYFHQSDNMLPFSSK